jgi:PAS domain S-box-containing protein
MSVPNTKSVTADARRFCRTLMDAINDTILIFDPRSFRILDVNKRATEVYGYPREEFVGKEMREITHEVPNYSDLLRGAQSIERTDFDKQGKKLPFLVSLCLIDFWGRKAVCSINRDIRERKRIEDAIAQSEQMCRSVMQNISEIVLLIDPAGLVRLVSPQVERVLGLSPSAVTGKNIFDFIHPDDRERAAQEYAKTIDMPGEGVPSVLRIADSNGHWIPFEIIASNMLHDPAVGAVIFTARDLRFRNEAQKAISEANADIEKQLTDRTIGMAKANAALRIENQQKRWTEAELQNSLSLLHATLESTTDGILVISNDHKVTSWNQKFMEMWHIPRLAVGGLRDEDLLAIASPQLLDPESFQIGINAVYTQPDSVSFDVLSFKDGRVFERYSQPQRVGEQTVGRVWSFRDVTHARRLEEELRQAQKMEAIGRLAGGIAHDFNNLLMLISGYAGQMLEDESFPEKHRDSLEQLSEATRRASSFTRQLLAFSRKQPVLQEVVDVNSIVSDMERMLQRLLTDRVRLVIHLNADPLPICADPSQIELVILNLAINARDAMPDGGVLSMITRQEFLSGDKSHFEGPPGGAPYVLLQISDTGMGMSHELQSHIFEPFFTTKDVGKGTGLGLSTAYGIVEQAGGYIHVESAPNEGATFRIYFPQATATLAETFAEDGLPVPTGDETVLLVEDETGIRTMTRAYLESLGYRVLEAASGREALQLSRQYQNVIALLVSDYLMPGMRGDELVHAMHQERPGISALLVSGFPEVHSGVPNVDVLEKPFTLPDLGRRVRDVLDRPPQEVRREGKPRKRRPA